MAETLVSVRWFDSHYVPGWTMEDIDPEPLVCDSVGWIIAETDEAIVLSSHKAHNQRCGDMTIPKCAITSQRRLRDG